MISRGVILSLISISIIIPGHLRASFESARISGRVVDTAGLAIAGARITLSGSPLPVSLYTQSDPAGRFRFENVPTGALELRVEKSGYFALVLNDLPFGSQAQELELVLNTRQEYEETISVVYSTTGIDREQTAAQNTLTSSDILDIPVPSTHDFRSSLPTIPGVIKDRSGRIHINGGREDQVLYTLDGFNIGNPVSGVLDSRLAVDSLRAIQVGTSRYSAEFGKGAAGMLALETLGGDDHFRFSATNFFPSFELRNGLVLDKWSPRATFSGPIRKGRAWFFNAFDLQYDRNTVMDLPEGSDTSREVFGSYLLRAQTHLTKRNILTGGFLFNSRDSRRLGLSALEPAETTRNRRERTYLFNVKDQAYLRNGWLLESGFAFHKIETQEHPMGDSLYRVSPEGRSGNYFLTSRGNVSRMQWLTRASVPPLSWRGTHHLKFGIDADFIRYRRFASRGPFELVRADGSRAQWVSFSGSPTFGTNNFEISAFLQDRWSPSERLLLEGGIRLDWDQIVRRFVWSPRLSATWSPTQAPDTKFSAGIGWFSDSTKLDLLTRPLDQLRSDTFFAEDGRTVLDGPIQNIFSANERRLRVPTSLNWSLGWEQKLPRSFFVRTEFIRKQGRHGWTYVMIPENRERRFFLRDDRRDDYSYVEWTVNRSIHDRYSWMVSYARSSARTSSLVEYSQDIVLRSGQGAGPLDWDAPNRLISSGVFPLPYFKEYTLSYFLEWHTGFPYSIVDEHQQLIGPPNDRRLPDYFSLNLHVERRFRLGRYRLALRAGFHNITDHRNPDGVNNNINAQDFGRLFGGQDRAFTGRLRFLGRN